MLVLGIDLAAQPASTGVVVLERDPRGRWVAEVPEGEPDDDALVRWGAGADKVGVDVPLGWPAPFVMSNKRGCVYFATGRLTPMPITVASKAHSDSMTNI